MDARLHTLTSTLDGCGSSASGPQPLYPQAKSLQCPMNKRIHGFQNWPGNPRFLGHPTHDLITTLTEVLEPNYLHLLLISTYSQKIINLFYHCWGGNTHHVHLPRGEPIVSVTV